MRITEQVVKNIIKKLLKGEDHRIDIVTLIDANFLQFIINFFKRVVDAKLKNKNIGRDWYKMAFLDPNLPAKEIAINSGLNKKTIHNMFNSSKKQIVIDASNRHYDLLYESIKSLIDIEHDLELTLTIKFQGVSVDLNISESLIVINTLAVKRSALRGGLWSEAGKKVEKPLMQSLCQLYRVPGKYYRSEVKLEKLKVNELEREVDFYLLKNQNKYKCEVKLMGKGNPESADAAFARDSKIFIADTLSEKNKQQLDKQKIEWVELKNDNRFKRFAAILDRLKIPYTKLSGNIDETLEGILKDIF